MELAEFSALLKDLAPPGTNFRPFVCRGNPFECKAFVVGLNPPSEVPFWNFWSDERGFDRDGWRQAYRMSRTQRGKPDMSDTRRRLDMIAEAVAPHAILETSLYTAPAPRIVGLAASPRDPRVFQFLFQTLQPAAILFHGRDVQIAIERVYGVGLSDRFESRSLRDSGTACVAAVDHLSRVSDEDVWKYGVLLREKVGCDHPARKAGQLRP